ncbi:MAG: TerB family tellurite resistance protein [Deltaproteobacteria bacterium]|nr:TerB family tellurite resistance protein [Deltaproteobacteria bacterium]
MGWLGKVIGGTIGFAMGGPLGAIAGAVFGHAFDSSGEGYVRPAGRTLSAGEETQMAFFLGAFSMLAKLAQVDGNVSREETASIERFMVQDLQLNPQSREVAITIFNTALQSPGSFESFARQFYDRFRFQPQLLDLMIDIMMRVSLADGVLSAGEEDLIHAAVRIFNLSESQYGAIRSRYVSDVEKYYAILGCSRSDSEEKIKRQYRKLVQEYHPDKIASKGLPEEFTRLAEEKFREIQEAYDTVKKERGIK